MTNDPYERQTGPDGRPLREDLHQQQGEYHRMTGPKGYYRNAPPAPVGQPYPRQKSRVGMWAAIITVLVLLGLCVGAVGVIGNAAEETAKELDAITASAMPGGNLDPNAYALEGCEQGEFGLVTVKGKITNSEDSQRTYWVTVQFQNADGESIGSTVVMAQDLAPGQTYSGDGAGFIDAGAKLAKCQVTEITRF